MVSDKSRNKLKDIITELREREDKMLQLENNLTYINKYASDINALVIMREIAKIVHEEEQYLKRIYSAVTLDRIKISVKGSSYVEAFEDLDITVKKATPMINIEEKKIQGQMVMVRASGYDNVKFQIKKRFSDIRRKEHITGCCVLPGVKIVLLITLVKRS